MTNNISTAIGLQPVADAAAAALPAVRRLLADLGGFDPIREPWVTPAPDDLFGVVFLLADLAPHLPAPSPGAVGQPDAGDPAGVERRLAAVLAALERVEERADAAADELPPGSAMAGRLRLLAWAVRAGCRCLWGEVREAVLDECRDALADRAGSRREVTT